MERRADRRPLGARVGGRPRWSEDDPRAEQTDQDQQHHAGRSAEAVGDPLRALLGRVQVGHVLRWQPSRRCRLADVRVDANRPAAARSAAGRRTRVLARGCGRGRRRAGWSAPPRRHRCRAVASSRPGCCHRWGSSRRPTLPTRPAARSLLAGAPTVGGPARLWPACRADGPVHRRRLR